jgi:hypothetical protein
LASAPLRAPTILAGVAVLALLYFAREVLVPITLAAILSLILAPVVRGLKRLGMGPTSATLTAVVAMCVLLASLAGMIAVQVVEMAASLPQYESTIRDKVKVIEAATIGRMEAIGRWQGPLAVPAGSVALCIGLGTVRDDLVTEILVRVLRERELDARHVSVADLDGRPPPGAHAESVATVFLVTMSPAEEWERASGIAAALHLRFQGAGFIGLMPDDPLPEADARNIDASVDVVVHSFEDAAQQALARIPSRARPVDQRAPGPPGSTRSA